MEPVGLGIKPSPTVTRGRIKSIHLKKHLMLVYIV